MGTLIKKHIVSLLFIITLCLCDCKKTIKPKLGDEIVLWGIVANGNTPYFELWNNKGSNCSKLDPKEFILYIEDTKDSSHKQYGQVNGVCAGLIIKPNTEYRITWYLLNSNSKQYFTKLTPPEFDDKTISDTIRNENTVYAQINSNVENNYSIAILWEYWKSVQVGPNMYNTLKLEPKVETLIALQNESKRLVLWPTKYLNTGSYAGNCPYYIDGQFRSSSDITLCLISKTDDHQIRKLYELVSTYNSPALIGEKLQFDYESGVYKAIVPFVSPYNKGQFYDFIPKKSKQILRIVDENGNDIDTNKYDIISAIMTSKTETFKFLGSNDWNKKKLNNTVYFDRDDLITIFDCDYNPEKSFNFDLSLKVLNKQTNITKEYFFENIKYENKNKIHTVAFY